MADYTKHMAVEKVAQPGWLYVEVQDKAEHKVPVEQEDQELMVQEVPEHLEKAGLEQTLQIEALAVGAAAAGTVEAAVVMIIPLMTTPAAAADPAMYFGRDL
jgi:hypothetical protein